MSCTDLKGMTNLDNIQVGRFCQGISSKKSQWLSKFRAMWVTVVRFSISIWTHDDAWTFLYTYIWIQYVFANVHALQTSVEISVNDFCDFHSFRFLSESMSVIFGGFLWPPMFHFCRDKPIPLLDCLHFHLECWPHFSTAFKLVETASQADTYA